ncbi:hypothetical protein BDB00DRAFT_295993 [Zychaea mexicana]|uniref:uncharacterized protein n=1 Tax=Zychaea mexicana TaxID=64656 RepID=UPI0022FE5421|nr:uncharacterized protein BDB00DRAFT_295993 [Zychaea mexicana]KAI9494599.1 hypothetical protein BDB00DRAFT_295993 [Zychaea mexicana]
MLLVLVLPKFYDDENGMISRRLLERIHRLEHEQLEEDDQQQHEQQRRGRITRRKSNLRRQVYIWTLRFLQLPHDQPSCWFASMLFILSLITLPWFRAEFIPSAPPDERFGTFYLWGLKFADEWIPIADTWMFAAEQVWLNIVVFVILFAWRSVDNLASSPSSTSSPSVHATAVNDVEDVASTLSLQKQSQRRQRQQQKQQRFSTSRRQLHEYPWFKGLEVVYWLWRVSELMALAAFYGGASALMYNILVVWLSFVGYNLAWGKGGMFNQKRRSPFPKLAECPCNQQQHNNNKITISQDQGEQEQEGVNVYPDNTSIHHILKATDDMMMVQGSSTSNPNSSGGESSSGSSSSSSGGSASTTPFNGSPRSSAKSRKRSLRRT